MEAGHGGGGAGPGARPALTVVIPDTGDRAGVQRCVDALAAAAPPGLEIIVSCCAAAGAQTDEAPAAAAAQVRVIRPGGDSAAAARTAALAAAAGEYVGFLEPGDEVEPGWAQALLAAAAAAGRPAIVKGEGLCVHQGRELSAPHACAAMARHTPLHWYGALGSAIYRRDLVQGHELRFAADCHAGEAGFQVQAVVAAMLEGGQIALCPQAVCRHRCRSGDPLSLAPLGRQEAAGILAVHAALHELFVLQASGLPQPGVGWQYCTWLDALFALTRRARYPQDAAAANALAQRLNRECPCPDALERERRAREFGLTSPPPS